MSNIALAVADTVEADACVIVLVPNTPTLSVGAIATVKALATVNASIGTKLKVVACSVKAEDNATVGLKFTFGVTANVEAVVTDAVANAKHSEDSDTVNALDNVSASMPIILVPAPAKVNADAKGGSV